MKNYLIAFLSIALAIFTVQLSGCDSAEPQSEVQKATEFLTSGSWLVETVTVGGVPATNTYKDLSITFSGASFQSVNGDPIWPATGTWSFSDDTAKKIVRNDGIELTVVELTSSVFSFEMVWSKTTLGTGRTNSLTGRHVFTFRK